MTSTAHALGGVLAAEDAGLVATGADGAFGLTALLVALPLLSSAFLLLGGRRTDRFGHWVGVGASCGAFVVAVVIWFALLGRDTADRAVAQHLFTWVPAGSFQVDAGLLVDPLSLTFVLLVTFVGTLIHVYSVAYMEQDADRRRFFAYLNFFVATMLLLVLADSYLLLYVGWEGVGLASYLLIGFWNHRAAYATAANKAFVVNRIGDVGLSLAIMAIFVTFGSTDFATVLPAAGEASTGVVVFIGLMLLLGACGKSAQFPLQSWLGDAMAGPTPVSALIHAATMVTAGVYLIVRSGPVFDAAPAAQTAVVVVGAVTLLFGALIGCAKDDIKKTLAASTMSQIGYMTLAAGLGPAGYVFAIFHLVTHGFFKAGMFLGAGSVMHGTGDRVDMRAFGGLGRAMTITWITFGLGWLAILGVPPFSGFWSKDKIIEVAFEGEGLRPWLLGGVAMVGAGITAFYMSRLFFMTFQGRRRLPEDVHVHESPVLMTAPMVVLAVGSVALGGLLYLPGTIESWLSPVVGEHEPESLVLPVIVIQVLTLVLVAAGVALAWRLYLVREVAREPRGSVLARIARRDLLQDDVNEVVFMRPGQYLTRSLVYLDNRGVDGIVRSLAAGVGGSGGRLKRLQTGLVRSYALSMVAGVLVIVASLLLVRV